MANASAKRIAAQNEKAIRHLRVGMVVFTVLSIFFRLLFRRQTFLSIFYFLIYGFTFTPSFFLYTFLVRAGTPRRDESGTLVSSGDDLNQAGPTEWSWDIIYITWLCQLGSSLFGEWVWCLYLIIPFYAGYKVWSNFISPIFFGRTSGVSKAGLDNVNEGSKRQEKLRKRQERKDPSVSATKR